MLSFQLLQMSFGRCGNKLYKFCFLIGRDQFVANIAHVPELAEFDVSMVTMAMKYSLDQFGRKQKKNVKENNFKRRFLLSKIVYGP